MPSFLLFSVSVSLVHSALGTWPTICGDAAHSGLHPAASKHAWAGASGVKTKWKYNGGGEVESSPVISSTKVFSAASKEIFALDRHTGKKVWSFQAKKQVLASGVLSGGLYMIGSDDNTFYALDQETGALKWKFQAGEFTGGATVDEKAGVVYAGSAGGLYAYDLEGKQRFMVKTQAGVNGSPAVDAVGNVLFGDDTGTVRKVNAMGEVLWKHKFDSNVRSPITLTSEGEVFLSNGDPDGGKKGQIVKMTPEGQVVWASNCDGGKNKCMSCWTAPQPVGDVVVAGCGLDGIAKGMIWGLDRKSGDVRWKIPAGNDCQTSSPVHLGDGKTVVLGCIDGVLYAVNAREGTVSWTFKAGAGIWATPAMDEDGTLFVSSHDKHIYALVPEGTGASTEL